MEEIINTNENNINKIVSRSIKLVIDNDNDLDDELQIPEHGFDNEGAVSHAKNLKDPGKYILQSCHDNDNYTNEVLKLLHEESNQTKFSKTSAWTFHRTM